ncbi:MAG: hypothetical protein GX556_14835 [Fibrobacter sp.]|nr:hypothetical protein [Fibrobacter sp.]
MTRCRIVFSGSVTLTDWSCTGDCFSVTALPSSIPGTDSISLPVRFEPTDPSGGSYSATLTVNHSDGYFTVSLSGTAVADPYCEISEITPSPTPWDTAATVSFVATADDSDDAGTGARISKYLWSSSLNGVFSQSTASFNLKVNTLKIGTHVITLRVIDNERDTSLPATDTLEITNRLPFAQTVSVGPDNGLIIKGSGTITLTGRAHDRDQFATEEDDSLASVKWYSTLQGRLGNGKVLEISSDTFSLGLHGLYLIATDNEGTAMSSDTMWIPVQTGVGRALIVAGTAFDDYSYFTKNIAPNCNWAYKKLRNRGFSNKQIYYMNPVGWQSLSSPLINSKIVDTTKVTLNTMRSYLLSSAVKNDVKNSIPLVIYLLGHGSSSLNNGKFYLNEEEYLTPDTLAAWLDSYGDLEPSSQIVVILDFCYSGTFLSKLRTVYTQNRVVISSSDRSNAAYFSLGKSFGWSIWNSVYLGKDLASAFNNALQWSDFNAPGANKANPLINCDNNGTYSNSLDMDIASNIYIGGSQQLQAITADFDTVWGEETSQGLAVTVRANGVFNSVWCRLYPPGYKLSSSVPAAVNLEKTNDSTWTGVYTGKRTSGVYTAVLEGVNVNNDYVMGGYTDIKCSVTGTALYSQKIPLKQFIRVLPGSSGIILSYGLPENSSVQIFIYDIQGKALSVLDEGNKKAGYHRLRLDNKLASLPSNGIFIFKMKADGKILTRAFSIVR